MVAMEEVVVVMLFSFFRPSFTPFTLFRPFFLPVFIRSLHPRPSFLPSFIHSLHCGGGGEGGSGGVDLRVTKGGDSSGARCPVVANFDASVYQKPGEKSC